MIKFEEVDQKEFDNGYFFDAKDCVLSEYDNDFYNAKEKIDIDLINEKIRLELYKSEAFIKNMEIKESINKVMRP